MINFNTNFNTNFIKPKNPIIQTDSGKKYEKPDVAQKAGAALGGFCAILGSSMLLHQFTSKLYSRLINYVNSQNQALYFSSFEQLMKNKKETFQGIKFYNAEQLPQNAFVKSIPKWSKKIPVLKKAFEKLYTKKAISYIEGKNSAFIRKKNTVLFNFKKCPIYVFHELGHALNKKNNSIGNFFQSTRKVKKYISLALLGTALLKSKKVEGEKPDGMFDKATTFVKNNIAPLALVSRLPILIEEAMASNNAIKFSKDFMTTQNFKALKKTYALAWCTYFGAAVSTAAALQAGSFIRDKLAQPKEVK